VGTVIVVGLRAEAMLARRLGLPVMIGGGTAAGAEVAARRAIDDGATALVSFGLAAGLDPSLRPGDLVVPTAVICDEGTFAADPALMTWLGGATPNLLLADGMVAESAETKHRLWETTGAATLDLESGAVARVATQRGLPFAALRVVCDPAERDLPPAALAALDARGAIGLARVASSVTARPGQIPALLRLAADAVTARRALGRRVRELAGVAAIA
jgi:adenosylhomocysteine nucleosidase